MAVGGKSLVTLTTDFGNTGPALDKAVWASRRPVMLTAANGRGVLCAYEVHDGGLELCYPLTQGRVGAGTRISLQRPKKSPRRGGPPPDPSRGGSFRHRVCSLRGPDR